MNYMSQNKDLNISTSSIHNFKTIENLEREFEFLKEEYEGTVVTNKILNKSNIDLKNQIKMFEDQLNSKDNDQLKITEQIRIIEELKTSFANLQNLQKDSNDLIQSLKQLNNELNHENRYLKSSFEEAKNACLSIENENEDLKKNIDNYEENTKNKLDEIFQFNNLICKIS